MGPSLLSVSADGVQIYKWDTAADGKSTWVFVGPRADLFDADHKKVGTHFKSEGGPEWDVGEERVVGQKIHERPSPSAGSIPELQLDAKSVNGGALLGKVVLIERLDTQGGAAPAATGEHKPGDLVEVPYKARYVFHAAP